MQFLGPIFESYLFIVSGCFVYLFWIFKLFSSQSNSNVKIFFRNESLLIFESVYYAIIIILVEKWFQSDNVIVYCNNCWTIYHPAKTVIVTGLVPNQSEHPHSIYIQTHIGAVDMIKKGHLKRGQEADSIHSCQMA